jgi:hypothetical protein
MPCPPLVSRHHRSPLFFATSSVPSHLTPPLSPCACPGASPELGVAPRPEEPTPSPPLSSGVVDRAGELHISVARPPHCELVLSTVSGRCVVVHGRHPYSPSHRPSSRRPPPTVPCCALCASSSCQSGRGMRIVSRVGVGLGNPHAPCRTTPGQATPYSAGSLHGARYRRLATGEPARTAPSHMLYAISGEARHAWAGVTPRGPASLAVATLFWPVRCCGRAVASQVHTVRVGRSQISAQRSV